MADKEFVENIAEEIVEMISNTKKILSLSQDIESIKMQQNECSKNISRLEKRIKEVEKALEEKASSGTGVDEEDENSE